MRIAIYARYSSEHQHEHSIDDQVRLCRERGSAMGGNVVGVYADYAVSGAHLKSRPEACRLLKESQENRFDMVIAEALDRLSRDQEDVAGLYKRLRFASVKLVTLSEGEVDELHVGLKGTMNALFLRDLAAKIKRGQSGRIATGLSADGLSYGYHWAASTINGNLKRHSGLLYNEAFVGFLVFNRVAMIKNPETGKRVSRPNPHEKWQVVEAAHLRIVSDEIWDAVQARKRIYGGKRTHERRRPRHCSRGSFAAALVAAPIRLRTVTSLPVRRIARKAPATITERSVSRSWNAGCWTASNGVFCPLAPSPSFCGNIRPSKSGFDQKAAAIGARWKSGCLRSTGK
jgi:site-specific DNA recombinase